MRICLLDLDGTLVDEEYHLTAPAKDVRRAVVELQGQGVCVGLHSDTPVETLRTWGRQLRMNGPVIAENGAIIDWPSMAISMEPTASWPATRREEIVGGLHAEFPGSWIVVGDVNTLSRKPLSSYTCLDTAILVNGFRRASVSLFVRGGGPLFIERVARVLESFRSPGLSLLTDAEYGFCSLRPVAANKTLGVRRLSLLVEDAKFCMIGNTANDLIEPPPDVLQVAVANASRDYISRCAIVTTGARSHGCIEALQTLLTH